MTPSPAQVMRWKKEKEKRREKTAPGVLIALGYVGGAPGGVGVWWSVGVVGRHRDNEHSP